MSFSSWLARSIGRAREGTKAHLVQTAELLACGDGVLLAMRSATDDECEAMLIEHVTGNCGCVADWREHPSDIVALLAELLPGEESGLLRAANFEDAARSPAVVWQMDDLLSRSSRGVRALETFGDAYLVVVVARELLPRFDEVNKHWLVVRAS